MQFPIFGRLLLIVIAGLVPGVAMLGYNEFVARQARITEIRALATTAARQAIGELDRIMGTARTAMIAASASSELQSGDTRACDDYLRALNRQLQFFTDIAVLDRQRKVVCGDTPTGDLRDAAAMAVELALQTNEMAVGLYREIGTAHRKVLPVAMPLEREDNDQGRVIALFIDLNWLRSRVEERARVPNSSLTIADRQGTIIARDPSPDRFVGSRIPEQFRPLLTASEAGSFEAISQDGIDRLFAFVPPSSNLGLYVSTGIAREEALRPIERATRWAITSMVLSIILSLLMGWLVGEQFVRRPVRVLLRTIDEWRANHTGLRTHMNPDHGEIEAVGHALDELMDESMRREHAREMAERERDLVTKELGHRIKNMLAIVQALARQSFRHAAGDAMIQQFNLRMKALANTYGVLLANDIAPADIREVVDSTLAPHREEGRDNIAVSGPECVLSPRVTIALALVLHELSTNAVKYGALAVPEGRVAISWNWKGGPESHRVALHWQEQDGPPVAPRRRAGFGTTLIERAFPTELHAKIEIDFRPGGVVCDMEFDNPAEQAAPPTAPAVAAV